MKKSSLRELRKRSSREFVFRTDSYRVKLEVIPSDPDYNEIEYEITVKDFTTTPYVTTLRRSTHVDWEDAWNSFRLTIQDLVNAFSTPRDPVGEIAFTGNKSDDDPFSDTNEIDISL